MKRKAIVSLVTAVMAVFFVAPLTALAAEYPLANGGSIDISTLSDGDMVTVTDDASVTITGAKDGVRIICGSNTTVALNGVTIDNSAYGYLPPLIFTGMGNTLNLSNTSTLTAGESAPGVSVNTGAELTISGSGTLNANGGWSGAGIGGLEAYSCGTVHISGGVVTATGGMFAAGIGGGRAGGGGTVEVSGGTVNATGGGDGVQYGGAGIGSGSGGDGGSITITGGEVTATGHTGGAGLGGGDYDGTAGGNGGIITISGASTVVNATGGSDGGAGIGGGRGDLTPPDGGTITINSGTVNANGGANGGAGIGGGRMSDSGDITIGGGTVNATGGSGSPGIGSDLLYGESQGTVSISGGTVTAQGSASGAGIGGGYSGESAGADTAPAIAISGTANVTATGGYGGAGLGGGNYADGGSTAITGGTVHAAGGTDAAGIGGGRYVSSAGGGGAGSITISGGIVYASGNGGDDIGNGTNGSGAYGTGGSLSISGGSAVFMQHDETISPATTTHTHTAYATDTEESYGYSIPSAWTPVFGSYLRLYTLAYNANGGSGTVLEPATQLYQSTVNVADGSSLSRAGYTFAGWKTAPSGGTAYAAGSTFTFTGNTTLYAQWSGGRSRLSLVSSDPDGVIYRGGRFTLTPSIGGGVWKWDETFFSATFNSPATFTALKAGTTKITYEAAGYGASYNVTVLATALPGTGQDITRLVILCGLAAAALAAGVLLTLRRRKTGS